MALFAGKRLSYTPPNPTDEIAIALVIQFLRLFMSHEDVQLHEVRF